jgi:hypothetical protein
VLTGRSLYAASVPAPEKCPNGMNNKGKHKNDSMFGTTRMLQDATVGRLGAGQSRQIRISTTLTPR